MKKLFPFLALVFLFAQVTAQTIEYLPRKEFQVEKKKISDGISASKRQLAEIKKNDAKMEQTIDSLTKALTVSLNQLGTTTDSLSKTRIQLNALQEKVDSQRMLSQGVRILLLLFLILIIIIIFVLIFLFKKKADANHLSLVEMDKKLNDRLDAAINTEKTEVQGCRDEIQQVSNHIKTQFSSIYDQVENKNRMMEKKLEEGLSGIESKLLVLNTDILTIRDGQSQMSKGWDEKLAAQKKEAELRVQALAIQAEKMEEEIKGLKTKK
jgi:predicted PurR-regulated permease PerM